MAGASVYFRILPEQSSVAEKVSAMKKLLAVSGVDRIIEKQRKIAIKVHVGEDVNTTYVPPQISKAVVILVKKKGGLPFLTETQTLYKGRRMNAVDHLNLAFEHGFTYKNVGAPFIMADGLYGDSEIEVSIKGEVYKKVSIAREALSADGIIFVSHPTGHLKTGLGATIKNIGMGLSSRKGKLRQHSAIKPFIKPDKCTFCQKCMRWCPEDAIVEKSKKAYIQVTKCIGCGECLAVCSFDAVQYNWGIESEELQRRVVEHALGIVNEKRGKLFFFNCLFSMTKDCDCWNERQVPVIPDIGILASDDPVAIDQATLDFTGQRNKKNLSKKSYPHLDPEVQLAYGEKLGLGIRAYELITV
jgi:uncharacterized Fe-S center protein